MIPPSKQSRIKALDDQQPWLAMSVSSFKTQAIDQIDGYTILLQPSYTAEPLESLTHHIPAPTEAEEDASTVDEEDQDAAARGAMLEEVESARADQQIPQVAPSRGGLQRFLCAEYTNSLA